MTGAWSIRGGTLIDAHGTRSGDVHVRDRRIVGADDMPASATEIDATDCLVSTGLVDLHAHLGEPGNEPAETIVSGSRAAVAGGFTTVVAMPDVMPCVDTAAVARHVDVLAGSALCHIEVAGAITVGRSGVHLAPLGELADAGVRYVTDCGTGVQNPLLFRRVLEYARPLGLLIGQAARSDELADNAHMHEGEWSSRLGLAGEPAEAEEIVVMRDVSLARLTRARVHFQTLSTAGAFAIVNAARRSGLAVSAEVSAAHISLADADLATYDTNRKVTPPLRSESDVNAACNSLLAGAIDAIVTDHTPCTRDRKERPFDQADPGTIGLETALGVALTRLDDPAAAFRALSWRPAELLGLGSPKERSLMPGSPADIVVVDPNQNVRVAAATMHSLARNSAFEGMELRGQVRATLVAGDPKVRDGQVMK